MNSSTPPSPSASEFIDLFFEELERCGIPYVVIHSYQTLPHDVRGDIDYAVYDHDLRKLTTIQEELGRRHNWAVVQSFQHGVCAFYNVLASLDDPGQILRLDACSNYARARRLLVPNRVLLDKRRRYGRYWIPEPSAEFIYEATKLFDAKKKDPANYISALQLLWEQDKDGAQQHFRDAFGNTGHSLEEWFAQPPGKWSRLRAAMLNRNKFGPMMLLREGARILSRLWRPTGVHITLLGSDDRDKSTLIHLMREGSEDFFRRFDVHHFRSMYFETANNGDPGTEPHGRPPHDLLQSMAKLIYCFINYWATFILKIYRRKIESTLIIFDRDFDDLLVEPGHYRLAPAALGFARLLRRVLPKPDITFILDSEPRASHSRSPDLPVAELERQQITLRTFAASGRHYVLIPADGPPAEVARLMNREILGLLLKRRGHTDPTVFGS